MSESDKAAKYAAQLYEARCNGQWQSVPELARKVEKHAPNRKCLSLAARAGALMNKANQKQGFVAADREYGASLSASLQNVDIHHGDGLDGAVARAAILLGLGQHAAALTLVPRQLHQGGPSSEGGIQERWTAVCVVLGTLVRGLALENTGSIEEAGNTYRSAISYLSGVVALQHPCPELLRWTEELLRKICLFFGGVEGESVQLGEAMAAFHLLSQLLEGPPRRALSKRGSLTTNTPRIVLKAHYEALSQIVREDLVYHPSPVHQDHNTLERRGLLEDDDFFVSRLQQRRDLKRVEANYETLLLQETKFPMANEINIEIKEWIELAMGNWRIFCGPNWSDAELGDEGKEGVARSTLDILYRASTKTFQSTQVLRHLFTVHTFLAEFNLAFRAFDTYVEIMNRGKERAEKSGKSGLDLDDDATAIRLAAEAIRIACRFGSTDMAEKAYSISGTLKLWLDVTMEKSPKMEHEQHVSIQSPALEGSAPSTLGPSLIASAYRIIAVSESNLARSVYDPTRRSELRDSGLENLRNALDQGLPDSECTETLYALSLLLAEMRDITGAVEAVKRALTDPQEPAKLGSPDGIMSADERQTSIDGSFVKERKLVPVWHLLSQLLAAREDFELAENACDAAFGQFKDSTMLFGQADVVTNGTDDEPKFYSVKSGGEKPPPRKYKGAVDWMDSLEKQALLEVKMTQLSLTDILEGPEVAVNGSDELLALFTRLFGPSVDGFPKPVLRQGPATNPPKSASGTIRSIFGRPKSYRKTWTSDQFTATSTAYTTRPNTMTTAAPTIQVIDEHGSPSDADKQNQSKKSRESKEVVRKKSASLRKKALDRQNVPEVPKSQNTSAFTSGRASMEASTARTSTEVEPERRTDTANATAEDDKSKDLNGTQPLGDVAHNMTQKRESLPQVSQGHEHYLPKQDTRLPAPGPSVDQATFTPRFETVQKVRHRTSLLVKTWLFIARLYCNASLFDDAKGAINEAETLATNHEKYVAQEESSVKNFQRQGWGCGKSVEELWADVYAERGNLFVSESLHHDALWNFEQALMHSSDHPDATVGLCSILLDMYSGKIPAEKPRPGLALNNTAPPINITETSPNHTTSTANPVEVLPDFSWKSEPLPLEMYRLADRDRAYALLSSLTRLGSSWDNAEAWFTLARAYEESGQIEKAKEALWWTVELEDTNPIRHWSDVNPGGYVL